MQDTNKTKAQLVEELAALRKKVAGIGNSEIRRTQKKEALGIQEIQVPRFFDLADTIFMVFDKNGIIIMVNEKACEVFECTDEQLINKNWFTIHKRYRPKGKVHDVPSISNFIHYKTGSTRDKAGPTGGFLCGDVREYEFSISPMKAPSGRIRYHAWHNAFILDEHKKVIGGIMTGKDVTDLITTVEELRESELYNRSVIQTASDAIFTIDSKGKIKSWNRGAEKIFGYSENEIIGKSFLLLSSKRFHKAQQEAFDSTISKGRLVLPKKVIEAPCIRKDGSEFPAELSISLWESGKKHNSTVIVRDATERKQGEAHLLHNQQQLKTQAQNLQDMNTALRVLLHQGEQYKKEFEEKFSLDVQKLILPYLTKLMHSKLDSHQRGTVSRIGANLTYMLSTFSREAPSRYLNLTPSEIEVANLVREGKRTKEIAKTMNISIKTVEFHRNNIRIKFGIKNKKSNLRSFLLSLR